MFLDFVGSPLSNSQESMSVAIKNIGVTELDLEQQWEWVVVLV